MTARVTRRISLTEPIARPIMIFDGDCNFCRCWIRQFERYTADRVAYEESQRAALRFPGIEPGEFDQAVILIEPDGAVHSGADAVLRLLELGPRQSWLAQLGRKFPFFMTVARVVYRYVARHRTFFSLLSQPWCGRPR